MATFTIAAVTAKKPGTTDGRRWSLYEVLSNDGNAFTTFDADWQRHVGETVEAFVSERNRLGTFPKAPSLPEANGTTPQPPAGPSPASPDRFAVLNTKLDRALEELAAIRRHFA
ncbi:MAG TPA: hypothetical protein VJT33_04030 [bacterium]|nr:hypothetical protein [bacterium]